MVAFIVSLLFVVLAEMGDRAQLNRWLLLVPGKILDMFLGACHTFKGGRDGKVKLLGV